MPTPIVSGQKTAFINLVQVINPIEANRLTAILNNYEDIPKAILRQLITYSSDYSYLKECMAVFAPNDTDLIAAGIYVDKTTSPPTNPILLVNCNYPSGQITVSTNETYIIILGPSTIPEVILSASTTLQVLYIGPGTEVDIADASNSGALINTIYLPFLKSIPSRLNLVITGSIINSIEVDNGSYFGGFGVDNPEAACALQVTALMAGNVTHDSIELDWTLPGGGFLQIKPYYKPSESPTWIQATQNDGDFIQQVGFIFRALKSDTYFDFKVVTICNNGGTALSLINSKTYCCPGPGQIVPATNCLITVKIKTSPDPTKTIALCNGVIIPQEYPAGPTLTIPYLAGKNITDVLIIDNIYYQDMPYNSVTGTWDASTTPVAIFNDGSLVSIKAQLPV